MAIGETIRRSKNYSWKEWQKEDGTCYQEKDGAKEGEYAAGRWEIFKNGREFTKVRTDNEQKITFSKVVTLKHDALCWCYPRPGEDCIFACKYITPFYDNNGDIFWYYIDPEDGKKTGKIKGWKTIKWRQ